MTGVIMFAYQVQARAPEPAPRTPTARFFLIAFLISWCFWGFLLLAMKQGWAVSSTVSVAILIAGSFGPFFAAFICKYGDGGWPAVRAFAKRSLDWRIAPRYLLPALFLVPLVAAVATYIHARIGGPDFALAMPLTQLPLLFLILLLGGGSVNEEFGWAYAIDRLSGRLPMLPAALAMGAIWACWHLPLFFIDGVSQSFMPFWAFLLFAVGARLVFIWAYEGTGKSILVTLLFHTTTNLSFNLFALVDHSPQLDQRGFIAFALVMVPVGLCVVLTGRIYRRPRAVVG
ncbi:MAG TPA: CPBP family glutamic-type intramembrane protease [Luteibacter sp.]|nr:CPBP family glutamic-type intramembrane protease [Luteibacter sp.]